MPQTDWLVGGDRHREAVDRIYAAAADLIAEVGYEAFSVEALASRVHCSPATIYRRAGGKAAIRDAVVKIQATQIVDTLREEIKDLHGTDRVLTATVAALRRMQSHPLTQHFRSTQTNIGADWLTNSPAVTGFAAEMLGTDDSLAAQWLIRVFLAMWLWPLKDPNAELAMLQRFFAASFTAPE
ncbi:TetR family transcriptional regulator [Mycobacterium intermedium]|uniref:TetR family transcriptional regulator n=1 Tax=Mycobacterium intermedium TaxID=28445 RepID=A0A1E3SB15_MYCIE|nr:helix-turn-helix domain-containing protein [Mycobacterium intermedium]MCV6964168.1 helix-turn-helix transcriptional regulator [Mycobacterium intermedium]ODQ98767.1 transcriptional regulator [Mycobacterium intermedium]OPE49868.1 TetR family transcriptional regulator [Mycobacterium intermedium]ORB04695.1 TetR family transcriptional regulator [Mycobacterium intermedium]